MTLKDIDPETIKQFRKDVGPAVPELVDLFIEETRARIARMDQLTADNDWQGLGDEAHALKGSARTYGLPTLADVANQLEHASRNNAVEDCIRFMGIIRNDIEAALDALATTMKENI